MLGFEVLKRAESEATERRKRFAASVEMGERMVANPEALYAQRDAARAGLASEKIAWKAAEERRAALGAEIEKASGAASRAEAYLALDAKIAGAKGLAEGLKAAIQQAEVAQLRAASELEERESLAETAKAFDTVTAALTGLEAARRQAAQAAIVRQTLAEVEAELRKLETALAERPEPNLDHLREELIANSAEAEKAAKALEAATTARREEQQNADKALALAGADRDRRAEALAKAENLVEKGICPECGQPIGEAPKQTLLRLQQELTESETVLKTAILAHQKAHEPDKALVACESAAKSSLERLGAAQDAVRVGESSAKAREDLLKTKGEREKEAERLRRQIEIAPVFDERAYAEAIKIRDELKPKHDRFLALTGAEDRKQIAATALAKAKSEWDSAKIQFEADKAKRAETGFDSGEAARLAIQTNQGLAVELSGLEAKIAASKKAIQHHEQALVAIEASLAEREAKLKEIDHERDARDLHDALAKEFRALREHLNATIRPDLIARASENLNLLTNGRYPVLDLDKSYRPILIEEGQPKQVISGGEEDVVALALRLALSELIQERSGQPMSLLILDEVFGSLDADRRQSVLERLIGLKGRFRQIFVISHIEEINQIADQCIYLQRDETTRATTIRDAVPEQLTLLA